MGLVNGATQLKGVNVSNDEKNNWMWSSAHRSRYEQTTADARFLEKTTVNSGDKIMFRFGPNDSL